MSLSYFPTEITFILPVSEARVNTTENNHKIISAATECLANKLRGSSIQKGYSTSESLNNSSCQSIDWYARCYVCKGIDKGYKAKVVMSAISGNVCTADQGIVCLASLATTAAIQGHVLIWSYQMSLSPTDGTLDTPTHRPTDRPTDWPILIKSSML